MGKILVSLVTGMLAGFVQGLQAGVLGYPQLSTPYEPIPGIIPPSPDTTALPAPPTVTEPGALSDWRGAETRFPAAAGDNAVPRSQHPRNDPQPRLRFRPWGQKGSFFPAPPAVVCAPGYEARYHFPGNSQTIGHYPTKPTSDYYRYDSQPVRPYVLTQTYRQVYSGPGYAPYYRDETAPPVPAYALPLSDPGDSASGYRDYTPRYDAPFFPRRVPVPAFNRFSP